MEKNKKIIIYVMFSKWIYFEFLQNICSIHFIIAGPELKSMYKELLWSFTYSTIQYHFLVTRARHSSVIPPLVLPVS